MSRRRRGLASLFILAFLAPHLTAALLGLERYPFTCAAMFATYVDDQTPRHGLYLTATLPDREEAVALGFPDGLASSRHFFAQTYGSAAPRTYHRRVPDDTPAAFEDRLSVWFRGFADTWARRNHDRFPRPTAIFLAVAPIDSQGGTASRTLVGRYDCASGRFQLDPARRAAYRGASTSP